MILIGSFVAAFFLGAPFGIVVLAYFFIELCYSLFLKKFAVLDALTVASETCMLLLGGGLICGKIISPWLFIFTITVSVLLVFCERRRAILLSSNAGQLSFYSVNYNGMTLEQFISITAVFALILYSFYALVSPEALYSNLVYSVPFVMWGVYRIIMLVYDKSSDKPLEKLLLKDKMLWLAIVIWAVMAIVLTAIK
jgi:4-hydroxybenzoate polyprenyltransferase